MAKSYWLMKSEPHVYSLDDLKGDKTTHWDGVRNYQARNHMMAMKTATPAMRKRSNFIARLGVWVPG
jgi:predicted RNA-binding protein with PUA-like domain